MGGPVPEMAEGEPNLVNVEIAERLEVAERPLLVGDVRIDRAVGRLGCDDRPRKAVSRPGPGWRAPTR